MGTTSEMTHEHIPAQNGHEQDVAALDRSEVFHLLQNSRRRAVVQYFSTFDGPTTIGDLAEQIAAWECDVPLDEVTKDQRQRVYISLYQSHLDKLDENDVVDYEDTGDMITTGANFHLLEAQLGPRANVGSTSAESGSPSRLWPSCYLGVALGGLVPLVAHAFQVLPQHLPSLQALNLVLIVIYVAIATAQFILTKQWS